MTILAVRSVILSTDTADAWKGAGVHFARRGKTIEQITAMPYPVILNLGKSGFQPPRSERIWNHGRDIFPLLWPGETRRLMGDLMPPQPTDFPADAWVKAPGAAGRGKYRKAIDQALVLPKEWDWQQHIEGQEWRLVTVGERLVQCMMRNGPNGNRRYTWNRMNQTPMILKELAREAARRLNGRNVVGWDLIEQGDTAYILEGNSCPGVGRETANRVVKEITRQMEEQNAE